MSEIRSRWYVEIVDYTYEFSATQRIYLPMFRDVDCRTLKKVWKHFSKVLSKNPNIGVLAFHETEDGGLEDMSQFWIWEEMNVLDEKGLLYF